MRLKLPINKFFIFVVVVIACGAAASVALYFLQKNEE